MPSIPNLTKIKELRRKFNLTQKDLEDRLNIPQATLSRIESGKGNPSYLVVKRIFDYLEEFSLNQKHSEIELKDIMTKNIIAIGANSKIRDAIELMNQHDISQLPIIENNTNYGSITSRKIQKIITDDKNLVNADIFLFKELPFPEVDLHWNLSSVSNMLITYPAVLIKEGNDYKGIITNADFLKISIHENSYI